MHLRSTTCVTHHIPTLSSNATVYTDGTCDNTRDPSTAREGWAAVLRTAHLADPIQYTFQVTAAGHCPGHQTINRSELYALLVAVEQIMCTSATVRVRVTFVTDSQFVVSQVMHIVHGTCSQAPHKSSHWDLVKRLAVLWDPTRFQIQIVKIASHRDIQSARNSSEAWHIKGNDMADRTAAAIRAKPMIKNLMLYVLLSRDIGIIPSRSSRRYCVHSNGNNSQVR